MPLISKTSSCKKTMKAVRRENFGKDMRVATRIAGTRIAHLLTDDKPSVVNVGRAVQETRRVLPSGFVVCKTALRLYHAWVGMKFEPFCLPSWYEMLRVTSMEQGGFQGPIGKPSVSTSTLPMCRWQPQGLTGGGGGSASLRSVKRSSVGKKSKGMGVKTPDQAVFATSLVKTFFELIAFADYLVNKGVAYLPLVKWFISLWSTSYDYVPGASRVTTIEDQQFRLRATPSSTSHVLTAYFSALAAVHAWAGQLHYFSRNVASAIDVGSVIFVMCEWACSAAAAHVALTGTITHRSR